MSEPRRRGLGRWQRLATPYVAIAALAFVASLGFYLAGHGPGVGRPAAVDLRPPQVEVANANQEVRLVLVDQSGLARPDFVTLDLPSDPAARLAVVLDALHAAMVKAGSWPQGLATPQVYVQSANRKQVAVLDLHLTAPVSVGVDEELQLLRSIRQTVLANGADDVRFLREGQPAATLLGHVAVDSGL